MSVLVGAGRAVIPFEKEDFPLKAFGRLHDDLYMQMVWMKSDINVVFLSIDMTSLPERAIQHFREVVSNTLHVEKENVFVSVTHSFSSPHIPPKEKNEDEKRLSDTIFKRMNASLNAVLEQVKESVCACKVSYNTSQCDINTNRNVETEDGYWLGQNPSGYSNHEVRVLSFINEQGIFAQLINFDLQSSTMDKVKINGTLEVSSDIAGYVTKAISQHKIVSLFLPGAAGDQAPQISGGMKLEENGYDFIQTLGQQLVDSIINMEMDESNGSISIERMEIECPEQEMKYPTKELKPHKVFDFDYTGKKVTIPLTLLKIKGTNVLMTTPELNSFFGEKVRNILGKNTMIVTLVNGACKYLPEKEDFEKITYTAMNTMLGKGSDEIFLENVKRFKERKTV